MRIVVSVLVCLVAIGVVYFYHSSTTKSDSDAFPEHKAAKKVFTRDEIAEFDGSDPSKPLYLVIKKRVYDVTSGRKHYGKGASYNVFVGKDNTRAFLGQEAREGEPPLSDLSKLSKEEMESIDNWVKFYDEHETYKYLGDLVD